MSVGAWLLVALAGGLGAACRYVVDYLVTQRVRGVLPWGTWLVNVSGSLALGLLAGLALQLPVPDELVAVVGGGLLGAYTTFSTWMYETLQLIEQGAWRAAAVNLAGSVVSGMLAAGVGLGVGLAAAGWVLRGVVDRI